MRPRKLLAKLARRDLQKVGFAGLQRFVEENG